MEWPPKDQPFDIEYLAAPLVKAVRFAYTLKRKNRDKDIPWKGPEASRGRYNPQLFVDALKARNYLFGRSSK